MSNTTASMLVIEPVSPRRTPLLGEDAIAPGWVKPALVRVGVERLLAGLAATTAVLGLAAAIAGQESATASAVPAPEAVTPTADVLPAEFAPYERQASGCPGLDPLLLVAIHDV